MTIKIFFIFLILLIGISTVSTAQQDSSYNGFGGVIFMDSLVVTASRNGFDSEDFIDMIRKDSSFYEAFENIRLKEYLSKNDIRFFDKNQQQIAQLKNTIKQQVKGCYRSMDILNQEVSGNYYKYNKKRRYYTARIYEGIFFTYEPTCHQSGPARPSNMTEKRIEDLKVLIFQPGSAVKVPVVGKKTQIFDKSLQDYYDYSIESKKYKSGIDCYVFSTRLKSGLTKSARQKTIIKNLETYFDKSSFSVVARNYHLYYNGALVDFDVKINIKLTKFDGQYVPEFLHFEGNWDIPFKPKERVWFETTFDYLEDWSLRYFLYKKTF